MKGMLNKMWRSVTALVLVLTMVLGTCGTAFAAQKESVDLPSAETIVSNMESIVEEIYNNEALKQAVIDIYECEDLKTALNEIKTSEELDNFLKAHPEIVEYGKLAYDFVTDEEFLNNVAAIAAENGVEKWVIDEAFETIEAAKNYDKGGREVLVEQLDAILAYLEGTVIPELQTAADEIKTKIETEIIPELEEKLEQLEAEFAAAEETVKEAIKAEIEKVKAEIERVKAIAEEIEAKVAAAIEAVEKAIDAIIALNEAVENLINVVVNGDFAAMDAAVEAVQAALNGVAKAIAATEDAIADINAVIDGAQEFLGEVGEAIEVINKVVEEAINTVKDAINTINEVVEEVIAAVEEAVEFVKEVITAVIETAKIIYHYATTAYYAPTADSFYVSLGDESVAGVGEEFGALLAEELGIDYENLGVKDGTIADVFATLNTDAATIAEADLITVGLSANAILDAAIIDAVETGFTGDWAALVGEDAAALVTEVIADLKAELEAELDTEIAAIMSTLVESLAYNYVEFVVGYPALMEAIRTVNPYATVIVVGMYNPLEDVVVDNLPIGDYVGYLTDITNLYLKGFAIATAPTLNTVYVDAPEVATDAVPAEYAIVDFAFALMFDETFIDDMFANKEGHEYIKDQILDAMVILTFGLLGDANSDGTVDLLDAILVLKHSVGINVELDVTVCDVDGTGTIDLLDAVYILKRAVGVIHQFPVEA